MKNCWSTLSYQHYLIKGDDALSFLQGQITQDIYQIDPLHSHYAGFCNAKGRLLAVFFFFYFKNELYFSIDKEIAEQTINHLKKYFFRSKISIELANLKTIGMTADVAQKLADHFDLSLNKTAFQSTQHDLFTINCLTNKTHYELIVPDASYQLVINTLRQMTSENPNGYRLCQLLNDEIHLTEKTVATVLPQNTALDRIGAINYKKGCYVGQEIIARNKHLGSIKKMMCYAKIDQKIELQQGEVITYQQKEIAKVFDFILINNQAWISAIFPLSLLGETVMLNHLTATFHHSNHFLDKIEQKL